MVAECGSRVDVFTDLGVGIQVGVNIERSSSNQMRYADDFVALDLSPEAAVELAHSLLAAAEEAQRHGLAMAG